MINKVEFRAMGCQMLAALDSQATHAAKKLANVPGWFEAWEQALSRFRSDSELAYLNRSAGQPVQVSQVLWQVYQAGCEAEGWSQGLVTPTVYEDLIRAGYEHSFVPTAEMTRLPQQLPLAAAAPAQPAAPVLAEHLSANRTLRLPEGQRLDFGGIAKGWAAHQAMLRLRAYGPALVDAGGDIAISGRQTDGQPWPVGIADPFDPEADLALLQLGKCGVATSGRDYRHWTQNGQPRHHIIDPRRGAPADTDVLAVTVVAPTVLQAETAAKVILISGSRIGLDWLEAHPGLAGFLVLENGQQRLNNKMEAYLWQ